MSCKKPTKGRKSNAGRKPKWSEEIVQKLEAGFEHDFTDGEACRHAGISESAYYARMKTDEEFMNRMRRAQDWPLLVAKKKLVTVMQTPLADGTLALKFLERRQKDRYTPKVIQQHEGEVAVTYADLEGKPKAKTPEEARKLAEEAEWEDEEGE